MVSLSRTDFEVRSWIVPLSIFFCMDFFVSAVCHKARAAAATCIGAKNLKQYVSVPCSFPLYSLSSPSLSHGRL